MINFIKSLFYSKDTKEVNVIFPNKANIFNCNADVEYDGTFFLMVRKWRSDMQIFKVGSNSLVAGNINSDWIFVLGEVKGDITANRVAIGPSAKVHGKISYNSISIEPGATILGNYFKKKHLSFIHTFDLIQPMFMFDSITIQFQTHNTTYNLVEISKKEQNRNMKNNEKLPIILQKVCAGFPSPATDYLEDEINLNEELITNKASTFLIRVLVLQ